MAGSKTSKVSKDGQNSPGQFNFAFYDPGDGTGLSPMHVLANLAGAPVNPATQEAVTAVHDAIRCPGVGGDGTIATAGQAQTLFSGATPPNGFGIYNPDPANDLWVSDTTAAAPNAPGSIRVVANGGAYETPTKYAPVGPVSVFGAVAGQPITARSW